MKTNRSSILALSILLMAGCGLDGPVPGSPQAKQTPSADTAKTEQKPAATDKGATDKATPAAVDNASTGRPARPGNDAAKASDQAPGTVREKAAVGMGEKGRGYGGGVVGLVTMPVHTLWTVKERLVLDQIKHDMDLYKAQDPNGKGPKSQKVFMEEIIKKGDIRLPTLPEGHRYVYDPATEELMVERPEM